MQDLNVQAYVRIWKLGLAVRAGNQRYTDTTSAPVLEFPGKLRKWERSGGLYFSYQLICSLMRSVPVHLD